MQRREAALSGRSLGYITMHEPLSCALSVYATDLRSYLLFSDFDPEKKDIFGLNILSAYKLGLLL